MESEDARISCTALSHIKGVGAGSKEKGETWKWPYEEIGNHLQHSLTPELGCGGGLTSDKRCLGAGEFRVAPGLLKTP